MPGSPYRTAPYAAAPMPIAYPTDDRALPMLVLAIMLAALIPPLTFGVLSLWDALQPALSAAEIRAQQGPPAHGAKHTRRVPTRRAAR